MTNATSQTMPSLKSLPLPVELQDQILSLLSLDQQVIASTVCSAWGSILSNNYLLKKRRYTSTSPLKDADVTLHRLVAASTGHMQCTIQDGKLVKYMFFYWSEGVSRPMEVDITQSPLLDDFLFWEQPILEPSGAVERGELRFRIGGVISNPILRGFFWHGEAEVAYDDAQGPLTVRQFAERIAENLKREIGSSHLLAGRGLMGEGAVVKFRPTARWALADNPGGQHDAIRDNMSVLETSARFGEKNNMHYGLIPHRQRGFDSGGEPADSWFPTGSVPVPPEDGMRRHKSLKFIRNMMTFRRSVG